MINFKLNNILVTDNFSKTNVIDFNQTEFICKYFKENLDMVYTQRKAGNIDSDLINNSNTSLISIPFEFNSNLESSQIGMPF